MRLLTWTVCAAILSFLPVATAAQMNLALLEEEHRTVSRLDLPAGNLLRLADASPEAPLIAIESAFFACDLTSVGVLLVAIAPEPAPEAAEAEVALAADASVGKVRRQTSRTRLADTGEGNAHFGALTYRFEKLREDLEPNRRQTDDTLYRDRRNRRIAGYFNLGGLALIGTLFGTLSADKSPRFYYPNSANLNALVSGNAIIGYDDRLSYLAGDNGTSPTITIGPGSYIGGTVEVYNNSLLNYSGGQIRDNTIIVGDGASIEFFGTNIVTQQIGTFNGFNEFVVTGTLSDGTPLDRLRLLVAAGATVRLPVLAVPAPAALPLFAAGFIALAGLVRTRRSGARPGHCERSGDHRQPPRQCVACDKYR